MRTINVSVVYAEREQQWIKELAVLRGSSVEDALRASGLLEEVEALRGRALGGLCLGIYAQATQLDALLEEGDRVEIYRPLAADPKEVRRQLALLGKTMGKKK